MIKLLNTEKAEKTLDQIDSKELVHIKGLTDSKLIDFLIKNNLGIDLYSGIPIQLSTAFLIPTGIFHSLDLRDFQTLEKKLMRKDTIRYYLDIDKIQGRVFARVYSYRMETKREPFLSILIDNSARLADAYNNGFLVRF